MPTWLIILLCLPPVLWAAYCFLEFVHGAECKGHCIVNFALVGLGMVGYGMYTGVGAFVGVGALVLFLILLCFGGALLVEGLQRKRPREKDSRPRE